MTVPVLPRRVPGPSGLSSPRGTAVTETMLLTWLLLVFFCAALQIFVMNESLIRTITAAHAQMFQYGFQHNDWKYDGDTWDFCVTNDDAQAGGGDYQHTYNTDLHAKVIINRNNFPEFRVQVLGLFRWFRNQDTVDIQSNVRGPEPDKGCPLPCKKIKMGAGPAGPKDEEEPYAYQPWDVPAIARLACKAGQAAGF